jgi:hypothetical protein
MPYLSNSLKEMGFVPTGEESPVSEEGELWTDGHELVCDDTGTVIDGDHHVDDDAEDDENGPERRDGRVIDRYENSGNVRLPLEKPPYDW